MRDIEDIFNEYQDIGSLFYKQQKKYLENNKIVYSFSLKNKKIIKNNDQEYVKLNKLSYKNVFFIKKDDSNINLRINSHLFILFFDEKYKIKINEIDFTDIINKYDIDIVDKLGYINIKNIEDIDKKSINKLKNEIKKSISNGIIKFEIESLEFGKKRNELEISQNIYNNNYWILQEIKKMKDHLLDGNKSIEKMKKFLNDESVEMVKKVYSIDIYYIFKNIFNLEKPRLLTENEIDKIEVNDIFKVRKNIDYLKSIKMINSKFYGVFQTNHFSKKYEKMLKIMNLSYNEIIKSNF